MSEQRRGLLFGIGAYGLWGLFPLYWPLLEPAAPLEILAHRIVWSLLFLAALVWLRRRYATVRAALLDRRTRIALVVASLVIGLNWFLFIWAVNNNHVVETSLGYFINPLVSVAMGVAVFGERLRRLQWAAIGIAVAGVLWLTVEYGRPPWISIVLALSFGTYGLAKKMANVGAVQSITVETLVLAPLALGYLVTLQATGTGGLGQHGTAHTLLLVGAGVATALPLLCFGAAATRIPLSMIGMLQYLTPTLQFLIGVFLYGEPMTSARWVGFALVWLALVVFTAETLNHRRRQLRTDVEATAA
ncbi:MAG: EamA family transporter RarD [Nocardioidaceae bacterium]